ncbi:septation protein SepH [Nocardioides terrisoli]|uniref:septation protein SepH n=1 Tax=Nocardioides terrisoli TaxID=3388267 RepID=UPI00287BA95F|nr:septation protein SepH [Nocardioides marmorisolisilvae]
MTELTPVGLSKDGKRLILVSAKGVQFSVTVDQRLRAALQGDAALQGQVGRLGQLEMTMESTLRPRDIQARIRAGESAEEVAAAAQTSVDRIMVYAGPVLAERAHIAQSAQSSSIRRRVSEAPAGARTLDEAALAHLRQVGLREDDVSWDAWRRDDGRWTLVADFVATGEPRRAEFTYDVPGRYVTAENDDARVLTGELAHESTADTAAGSGMAAGRARGRRLSAVPAQDELPLGDDAIELVRDRDTDPDADLIADHADADWIAERADPAAGSDDEPVDGAAPVDEPVDEAGVSADAQATAEGAEDTVEVPTPPPSKRKGRSSVPSWDEIMFGGGNSE